MGSSVTGLRRWQGKGWGDDAGQGVDEGFPFGLMGLLGELAGGVLVPLLGQLIHDPFGGVNVNVHQFVGQPEPLVLGGVGGPPRVNLDPAPLLLVIDEDLRIAITITCFPVQLDLPIP